VFLAVLAVATALEVVVVVTVMRPLAAQRSHERTELALDRASRQIAALYDPYDLGELERVLRDNRLSDRDAFLVFRAWDGRLVADHPLARETLDRVTGMLAAGLVDSSAVRGATVPGPPEPARSPLVPADAELALLGHRAVSIEGSRFGEVAALGSPLHASLEALPETRALVLFLPFAVLASGVAGILMVRILANRLRALEQVAARVTGGELGARVESSGRDEIGRLEERFNLMTERLALARADLEQTDRQRRRLFGDITHELATPLTSIRGYVETLLDPRVPVSSEERATYLNDVLEEAKRLDLLISELLELTRLEAGATPLQLVRLDWTTLCRNVARRMAGRFADAGLTLEWSGAENEAWVRVDGRRLEQVVDNLLGNALRYVPAGGSVRMTLEGAGEPPTVWRLTVSDDGPGISAEDIPHVFERFYRAEAVRANSGTGLGLAIVREVVSQHGGTVRAEARQPRGAAFIVELPAIE
jgi:signal transduction histidine kinase